MTLQKSNKYDFMKILKAITLEIKFILFSASISPVVNRECIRFLANLIQNFDNTSFRLKMENRKNFAIDSSNSTDVILKYKSLITQSRLKKIDKKNYFREGIVIQLPNKELMSKVILLLI